MPERSTQSAARVPAELADGRWLKTVRGCAVAGFVAVPVFAAFSQRFAGRIVWTVVVAGLPLLIVVAGYHPWRRICPLAWFSQLAVMAGRPGQRRASPWLQAHYYYVAFAIFVVSLWMRLVATNGDSLALAAFFALLALAALVFGATFTGKTWCNYICPVSVVEKIYTEPRGLRPTANSQCVKCTACKPACPDINQENGYWKDILLAPKRFVYFAFPGVVFSFYFYYYLQSGTWDYYFGGAWTNQPRLWVTAFLPGHDARTAGFFFWPAVPRAVAALATLVLGMLASRGLFGAVEQALLRRRRQESGEADEAGLRHMLLTTAAFVAFVTFYTFAGAPTLRLVPGAPHLLQIVVVGAATLFLVRRFARRQAAYAEETLARQIIRRWEWQDMKPPKDLHEAFLIHTIRSQTHASGHVRLLEIYRDAVRESVASGLVSRADVQRLESLRTQLQITQTDHEKIMADLAEEERALIASPQPEVTAEKRLQLQTYSHALRNYLERVAVSSAGADDAFVRNLRQEYGVTPEEHAAVLDDLLGRGQGIAPVVARALDVMESGLHTIELLRREPSEAGDLLLDTLARRRIRAAEGLMRGFGCTFAEDRDAELRDRLLAPEDATREQAIAELGRKVGETIANHLRSERRKAAAEAATRTTLADSVRPHLTSADPYLRVAALYLLAERHGLDQETLTAMMHDEHEVVGETAMCLVLRDKQLESRAEAGLVTVERMIALRSVSLFASLAPEDLANLARAAVERVFVPGAVLCEEGETGDEVFILMSGETAVLLRDGAQQKLVGREKAGGFIGELAVLDPGPRPATVVAGDAGAHVLCLGGDTFRGILRSNPAVVGGVMRALVSRIRETQLGLHATDTIRPQTPAENAPAGAESAASAR